LHSENFAFNLHGSFWCVWEGNPAKFGLNFEGAPPNSFTRLCFWGLNTQNRTATRLTIGSNVPEENQSGLPLTFNIVYEARP
jgi:hypothetical protein